VACDQDIHGLRYLSQRLNLSGVWRRAVRAEALRLARSSRTRRGRSPTQTMQCVRGCEGSPMRHRLQLHSGALGCWVDGSWSLSDSSTTSAPGKKVGGGDAVDSGALPSQEYEDYVGRVPNRYLPAPRTLRQAAGTGPLDHLDIAPLLPWRAGAGSSRVGSRPVHPTPTRDGTHGSGRDPDVSVPPGTVTAITTASWRVIACPCSQISSAVEAPRSW
jgi:hypothetical protein